MSAYLLLLGCSSLITAACGGFVLSSSDRPESRIPAVLFVGASFWGFCEVLANTAASPEAALTFGRLSALGWCFIGPLALDLLVRIHQEPTRLARLVPGAYAVGLAFLAAAWLTPWVLAEPVQTSWGWGLRPGPAHRVLYGFTILCIALGFALLQRTFRTGVWEGERRQRPLILAGMFVPLVGTSFTDALLPWLGQYPPRLGSVSFAVLGILAVTSTLRFGYSMMSPGTFSDEILRGLGEGVALLHRSGRIRSANDGLARLAGRTSAELESLHLSTVVRAGLPRELEEVEERTAELERAGGERIPVALSSRVVRDRLGSAVGLAVALRDLREVESLRSGLVMSARLAAVGQLAAGIAHEINNPLAFVRANLNQLRDHWKVLRQTLGGGAAAEGLAHRVAESEELIDESLEGVDRAAEIVRGVKGFSHAGSVSREDADVNALLDQVVVMATPQLRGLSVERCLSDLPRVHCAPQQLKQVFLNLVINGAQAAGKGGHLRIATHRDGEQVRVEVRDDGCGIEPGIAERIFDPFFTTKAVGEGTGLGLAIAYQIVHSHGGTIEVESEPGVGSCFRVRLAALAPS